MCRPGNKNAWGVHLEEGYHEADKMVILFLLEEYQWGTWGTSSTEVFSVLGKEARKNTDLAQSKMFLIPALQWGHRLMARVSETEEGRKLEAMGVSWSCSNIALYEGCTHKCSCMECGAALSWCSIASWGMQEQKCQWYKGSGCAVVADHPVGIFPLYDTLLCLQLVLAERIYLLKFSSWSKVKWSFPGD